MQASYNRVWGELDATSATANQKKSKKKEKGK
jgi:hypothetical protein